MLTSMVRAGRYASSNVCNFAVLSVFVSLRLIILLIENDYSLRNVINVHEHHVLATAFQETKKYGFNKFSLLYTKSFPEPYSVTLIPTA